MGFLKWLVLLNLLAAVHIVAAQELIIDKPELLGSEINTAAEEVMPLYDPYRNILYFARALHKENTGGLRAGSDIWIYDPSSGTTANADSPWNNKENNAVIGVSRDTVFLLNGYKSRPGIAFSVYRDRTWQEPVILPLTGLYTEGPIGFYLDHQAGVLVISMVGEDSYGQEDLYLSVRNKQGKWSLPENLGPGINTAGAEISPFLYGDRKTLFFSSTGHESKGSFDVYFTRRLYNSWYLWSTVKPLPGPINSSSFEAYFSAYDSVCYFSSNREGKSANIFSAPFEIKERQLITLTPDGGSIDEEAVYEPQNFTLLDSSALTDIFGINLQPIIQFETNTTNLKPVSAELLYFIANKLVSRDSVLIHIQYPKSDQTEENISPLRARRVTDFLANMGISTRRILEESVEDMNRQTEGVRLLFSSW